MTTEKKYTLRSINLQILVIKINIEDFLIKTVRQQNEIMAYITLTREITDMIMSIH